MKNDVIVKVVLSDLDLLFQDENLKCWYFEKGWRRCKMQKITIIAIEWRHFENCVSLVS